MNNTLRTLDTDGYALVAGISPAEVAKILDAAESLPAAEPEEVRGGYRDLFTLLPAVRDLAGHPGIRRWPAAVLGP
ncbi:MAG: hypothetical protein ABI742_13020, partial [Gemmatimonadota bacterium]